VITFLTGGARSGKSSLAVRLAEASGLDVCFVATGEAHDEEMADRINRHKAERPATWTTIEAPVALAPAIARIDPNPFVIVDCLSLWVSNLMVGEDMTDEEIHDEANVFVESLRHRSAPLVVVTNEVGLGIVPDNALARRYRDVLGRVNALVSSHADVAYLVVSGRTLTLERPPA
jgi:adenosylcobinamide kinase / adenosylcobinamide-phosphate guanylyltransferase